MLYKSSYIPCSDNNRYADQPNVLQYVSAFLTIRVAAELCVPHSHSHPYTKLIINDVMCQKAPLTSLN